MNVCIRVKCSVKTKHQSGACALHNKRSTTDVECSVGDCLTITRSKSGICKDHKAKREWARQKALKQRWVDKQPEDNIGDAVIRYAITNNHDALLFTNTATADGSDCLLWLGHTSGNYGSVGISVKTGEGTFSHPVLAHRLAYAVSNELPPSQTGPNADTLTINHICRQPLCVNPSHLEVLTQAENSTYGGVRHNIEAICVICESIFETTHGKQACSDECDRLRINKQQRTRWVEKQTAEKGGN